MPATSPSDTVLAGDGQSPVLPASPWPRNRLLARITSLTSVTTVAAAAMIVIGVSALVGGNYTKQVVHDQLAPQKIFFPAAGSSALLPGVKQYAGQQLLTGSQAKAYANNFIGVHVTKIAAGQTYAQVSTKSQADPKNASLTAEKTALFQGETLRGLLLSAWGWSVVGTIATFRRNHPDRRRRRAVPAAAGQLARQPAQPHPTGQRVMKALVYIGAGVTPPQTGPRVSVMQTAAVLGPNPDRSGKART